MKYLSPIENLEKTISRDRKLILLLIALLALAVTVIPLAMKKGNPLLVRTEKGIVLSEVEPWKLSVARIEGFTRAYLSSRFEWSEADIAQKRQAVSNFVSPAVFAKLKDSIVTFETLARNQKAKSYYVLEDFHFSADDHTIEAKITRVLRIQNAALATPLLVGISYSDATLSPENPFGMHATSLNEAEVGTP